MSLASVGFSLATSFMQKLTSHHPGHQPGQDAARPGAVQGGSATSGHNAPPQTAAPATAAKGGTFADLLQAFT
ncbi:MAG TPA: hypothetical protein VHO91_13605 [Rhodopila sp.]|nr:hypothetical protein [Rhodopila sp.]